MASSANRAGRITDRRAQAKRRRRRALWCLPVLAVLAVLAVHLHLDAMAADLSARSRAALRAADFAHIEVAFNGREAMVRGHVANGLHMAAVETIIESQRGVRWADLRSVTVGGAAQAPVSATAVSASTLAAPSSVAATPSPDAGVPTDAGRPDMAPIDAGPIAVSDASPRTDADAPEDAPVIALTWTEDGPVVAGALPSEAARTQVTKAMQAALGEADWTNRTVVQAGASPDWLPALLAVLPQLEGVDGLTLHVDQHRIRVGGAVVDAATRARIEEQLDGACPAHVVQNELTIMAPPAQVAARMHAVRGLDLFFGPDGVNLTEDGAAELAQVAEILKRTAGAVRIESHTDNVGKPETNQARSDARAAVVRDALQANGVPGARLHAVGRGARNPIADNSTQDGRALNRRIVITLDP